MNETIMHLNGKAIAGLQELVRVNIDTGKGFREAAELIENKDIASYFRRCGERRHEFAAELQRIIGIHGVDPECSGSATGTMRRWWLFVRGTVQGGDEHAVLAEAERGEDAIKHKYEEVIQETAGGPLTATLNRQYESVKQDHDTIRDMRDARE